MRVVPSRQHQRLLWRRKIKSLGCFYRYGLDSKLDKSVLHRNSVLKSEQLTNLLPGPGNVFILSCYYLKINCSSFWRITKFLKSAFYVAVLVQSPHCNGMNGKPGRVVYRPHMEIWWRVTGSTHILLLLLLCALISSYASAAAAAAKQMFSQSLLPRGIV